MTSEQLDQSAPWVHVVLICTSFPFVIAARIAWQYDPGLFWCALFWLVALGDEPIRWRFLGPRRRVGYGFAFLGGLGNAVATLMNNGRMPVLTERVLEPDSLWVPLTDMSRVPWLCDVLPWGVVTGSIGDVAILAGLLLLLLGWIAEKVGLLDKEAVAGNKMPGLGIG